MKPNLMDFDKISYNKQAKILSMSLKELNIKKRKEIQTHTNTSIISNNGGIDGLIMNAEQIIGSLVIFPYIIQS